MIRAQNLEFSYGLGHIFNKASFSIGKNQKAGLVGPNGAGKSTLFKLITQQEQENSGSIKTEGAIAYVPQEIKKSPEMQKSKYVTDYIDPNNQKYDYEKEELLRTFGLNLNLHQNPNALSGGQKTKLTIIRALTTQPDILLLDEPTNFLDQKEKKWAMNLLKDYPHTLLIISHDLKLLNEVLEKVLFINTHTHKIDEYKGNYNDFQRLKKEKEEHLRRQITQEKQHIRRMEEGLKKLAGRKSEKGVRQKIQLQKRIEKAKETLPEMPHEVRKIKMSLPDPMHVGELPVRVKNIYKSYNTSVLENLNFSLRRGERVALIGPNGAGKSTLIKIIMNTIKPDSGEILMDEKTKIGYYAQDLANLPSDETIFDIADHRAGFGEHKLRPYLARFLFSGKKVFQKIESLSGGEKTRLAIALIMLDNHNVLILDEPTTYLDPLSQRIILEALKEYKGTLLVASHTEEFITELNPNRAILLPNQEMKLWDPEFASHISLT